MITNNYPMPSIENFDLISYQNFWYPYYVDEDLKILGKVDNEDHLLFFFESFSIDGETSKDFKIGGVIKDASDNEERAFAIDENSLLFKDIKSSKEISTNERNS